MSSLVAVSVTKSNINRFITSLVMPRGAISIDMQDHQYINAQMTAIQAQIYSPVSYSIPYSLIVQFQSTIYNMTSTKIEKTAYLFPQRKDQPQRFHGLYIKYVPLLPSILPTIQQFPPPSKSFKCKVKKFKGHQFSKVIASMKDSDANYPFTI